MKTVSEISHEAIVQSVENDYVTVLLSPGVACSGCQAESSCGIYGNSKKILKINGLFKLEPGEKVEVSMIRSQGYKALFLGYILPLLLVVTSLVTLTSLHTGELVSGVLSLAVLIPYYIILRVLRRFVGKKFSFTIKTTM